MNLKSIFVKNDDCCEHILAKNDVFNTIPKNCCDEPNKILQKTHTEWRWRFFKIDNKEFVEISKKLPNQQRVYKTANEWIPNKADSAFKQFVITTKYYYIECSA